jgi:hypothetical protein
MLPKNIYSSKYYSVSSVGMDRPEFTPLKRGKSLDEGGNPQVGEGRRQKPMITREAYKWEEAIKSIGEE